MRDYWYRNKSLGRFKVAIGSLALSPDPYRAQITIEIASLDSPGKTCKLTLSVPWEEVHSCYRNTEGHSASGTVDLGSWANEKHLWEKELGDFTKYAIVFDEFATFADTTILLGPDRIDGVSLYVKNGSLHFTQRILLQIEENRIARRLALKIAYDRNQEGIFAVRNEEGQFLLPYLSEDFISFPLDIFGEAVLNLETGGLLKRESDTYRITLKGRHEYEGGPKSSQHKAFIIASCSRAVRPAVEVYREVLKNFDYEGIFQEEEEPVNTIEADIFQNIDNSKLIIADMTEHRPNCYLELGYAMALGKRIILVISEKHRNEELLLPSGEKILKDGLTFDTRQRRYTFYKDADDLREELTKRIRANLEMIQKAAEI